MAVEWIGHSDGAARNALGEMAPGRCAEGSNLPGDGPRAIIQINRIPPLNLADSALPGGIDGDDHRPSLREIYNELANQSGRIGPVAIVGGRDGQKVIAPLEARE